MGVFIVMVLSMVDYGEPFGVYSTLDKAIEAKKACIEKFGAPLTIEPPTMSSDTEMATAFHAYKLLAYVGCEIWHFAIDGERLGYAPEQTK